MLIIKSLSHLSPSLKFTISYFIHHSATTTSTLLFLAVCRTRVLHELSLMASLSMSSRNSVDRALPRCSEGHGFDSRRGLRFFVPRSCHVDYLNFKTFHYFSLSRETEVKWNYSQLYLNGHLSKRNRAWSVLLAVKTPSLRSTKSFRFSFQIVNQRGHPQVPRKKSNVTYCSYVMLPSNDSDVNCGFKDEPSIA